MKYYVEYPITLDCRLGCHYCFHADHRKECILGGPQFEAWKYARWRDTHLRDAKDIIIHFHGGEPSTPLNVALIERVVPHLTIERVDMLTNGLGKDAEYDRLLALPVKWNRVGFTYHRPMIGTDPKRTAIYHRNLMRFRDAGIQVFAKELLFVEFRESIRRAKKHWEKMGIPFKVQDYKGSLRGEDFTDFSQYTKSDMALIDAEYKHPATGECACRAGYKPVLIRGGWQDGDVVGCWIDPCVVGNIHDNTYSPGYRVVIDPAKGKTDVQGVPKVYRGTFADDRWLDNQKVKN